MTLNYDHTVIDEREDGIYMYFHDLPHILFDDPVHISGDDLYPPDEDT